MNGSTIDFSAQFGGTDAASFVLPHFKALKAAAQGISVTNFPLPELAFILRVDGEVNQYGLSGLGDPEIDKKGRYLSVDLGLQLEDRKDLPAAIVRAIDAAETFVSTVLVKAGRNVDRVALAEALRTLVDRYRELAPGK
jgi:hypothetical protein